MSERGSFISEYVYCDSDFEKLKKHFESRGAGWFVRIEEFPIIAGKASGLGMDDELLTMMDDLMDLETKLPIRFIVVGDSADKIWLVQKEPDGYVNYWELGKVKAGMFNMEEQ